MKAKLTYQSYGSSILIFIQGETEEDAMGKWMSLFNWGATSTEPRWVANNVIACWSTIRGFQKYLFNIHENRGWDKGNDTRSMDLVAKSYHAAKAEFDATANESYRSVNNDSEPYQFGVICAENPDDDFKDNVLKYAFRS